MRLEWGRVTRQTFGLSGTSRRHVLQVLNASQDTGVPQAVQNFRCSATIRPHLEHRRSLRGGGGGGAGSLVEAPQLPQNLSSVGTGAWHFGQSRCTGGGSGLGTTEVPQWGQNFLGLVISVPHFEHFCTSESTGLGTNDCFSVSSVANTASSSASSFGGSPDTQPPGRRQCHCADCIPTVQAICLASSARNCACRALNASGE